jgi:hypothetical protein
LAKGRRDCRDGSVKVVRLAGQDDRVIDRLDVGDRSGRHNQSSVAERAVAIARPLIGREPIRRREPSLVPQSTTANRRSLSKRTLQARQGWKLGQAGIDIATLKVRP